MINTIDFTICDEEGFTKHEHTIFPRLRHDIAWQILNHEPSDHAMNKWQSN